MAVEQLIFTDVAPGKGFDTSENGYQIRACSAGLAAEQRSALRQICVHYGKGVHERAPRASLEREMEWQRTTSDASIVPAEVVDTFPIIWSYDRLKDDSYALTEIRYAGTTHDGRVGNFFAHALVFDPTECRSDDSNPLTLTRSGLFRSSYSEDSTELETLHDLNWKRPPGTASQILRNAPFVDRVASMVAALASAPTSGRPVVVCIDNWATAGQLVQELLYLLPRHFRARTTFCTYEHQREFSIRREDGTRRVDAAPAHELIIQCSSEGRSLDLRPDEYRSTYAVFNFVENQFSDFGEPGPYASFAARSVQDHSGDRMSRLHELIERLGVERTPADWDTVTPLVELLDGPPVQKTAMLPAARVLSSLATAPVKAQVAFDLLWPHIKNLAQTDDAASLGAAANDLATLMDRLPSEAIDSFVPQWTTLLNAAVAESRGRTAAALLKSIGRPREKVLIEGLTAWVSTPSKISVRSQESADRVAIVDVLVEGLALAGKSSAFSERKLLVTACRVGRDAGLSDEVWSRVGASHVEPALADPWHADKQKLAVELLGCFPPDASPRANAAINLRLLAATTTEGEEFAARLKQLAQVCPQAPDAETLAADLVKMAEGKAADAVQRIVLLGNMAEAAYATTSGKTFLAAYDKAVLGEEEGVRNKARRALASEGASQILSIEALNELTPWTDDSPDRFRSWWDVALKHQARLFDRLCGEAADRLQKDAGRTATLPLAEALLSRSGRPDAGPGALALWEIVAKTLPLEAESAGWLRVLASVPPGASSTATQRIAVVKFVADTQQKSKASTWSVVQFPHKDPAWRAVRGLEPGDRKRLVSWAIDTLDVPGVTTPAEADAFVQILDAVDFSSDDEIATAVAQLTSGRDPVTSVLVAMNLVRTVIDSSRSTARYGNVLGAILDKWDRNTVKLFEAHLARRFGRRESREEERLAQLCEAARINVSKPESAKPVSARPKGAQANDTDASLLDKVRLFGRKLWRTEPDSPSGKKGAGE
jgi:hypothetical protein